MLRHSTAVSLWPMARKPMAPHGQAESKNDSKSGSHGHASALTSDYAGLQIILSEMISERLRSIKEERVFFRRWNCQGLDSEGMSGNVEC